MSSNTYNQINIFGNMFFFFFYIPTPTLPPKLGHEDPESELAKKILELLFFKSHGENICAYHENMCYHNVTDSLCVMVNQYKRKHTNV